jgi:hypothetical protein
LFVFFKNCMTWCLWSLPLMMRWLKPTYFDLKRLFHLYIDVVNSWWHKSWSIW